VEVDLNAEENYGVMRDELRRMGTQAELSAEEIEDLVLASGEAITNAIKHAVNGRCQAVVEGRSVIVRVSDKGEGIHPDSLPETLFQAGFSTKISLGLGYTLILKLVDEMWLATGPEGTVLQLIKRKPTAEDEEAALLALLDRF
jgi:anti-sigma regulatory factor (Ser/Thr protein kinase)